MTDWRAEHDAELSLRREWSARAQKAEAEIERLQAVLIEISILDDAGSGDLISEIRRRAKLALAESQ